MKKSTILKQAKKHLGKDPRDGVCYALDDWLWTHEKKPFEQYETLQDTVRDIQNDIGNAIYPNGYAHRWLARKVLGISQKNGGLEAGSRINNWVEQNKQHLPAWRKRWMDKMIADYKAKGE